MDTPAILHATGTSGANAIGAVSTPAGKIIRVHYITVKYSAAPTQAGVTVTFNAGAGAAFDTLLNTGTANAQNTFYMPTRPILLSALDALDVSAPAGGVAITSSIDIAYEVFG